MTTLERIAKTMRTLDVDITGHVGPTSRFNELGWTVNVFHRFERALRTEFAAPALFTDHPDLEDFPTVGELANHIDTHLDQSVSAGNQRRKETKRKNMQTLQVHGPATVEDHVIQAITSVDANARAALQTPASNTSMAEFDLASDQWTAIEGVLCEFFHDGDLFDSYRLSSFQTLGDLVAHIMEEIGIPVGKANKSKDKPKAKKTKGTPPKQHQPFSDGWLYQQCHRYSEGLLSSLELVMNLQLPPEVVASMLLVNKLPYKASRKIEISDLMHDDPRIEAAASDEDEAPLAIPSYEQLQYNIRSKLAVPNTDLHISFVIGGSDHSLQLGVQFGATDNTPAVQWANEFLQYILASLPGSPPRLVSATQCELNFNIVWVTPALLEQVGILVPRTLIDRLHE